MRLTMATGLAALLATLALAGCSSSPPSVREFTIHVGTHDNGTMYMTPSEIKVKTNDKVRFIVVNDDASTFHDVALLDYAGHDYEHEAKGGSTVRTCSSQPAEADKACPSSDFFTASAAGTFTLKCEVLVPNHEALGMKATFVVEA